MTKDHKAKTVAEDANDTDDGDEDPSDDICVVVVSCFADAALVDERYLRLCYWFIGGLCGRVLPAAVVQQDQQP
jgi:hypothetical protein